MYSCYSHREQIASYTLADFSLLLLRPLRGRKLILMSQLGHETTKQQFSMPAVQIRG